MSAALKKTERKKEGKRESIAFIFIMAIKFDLLSHTVLTEELHSGTLEANALKRDAGLY